jgi:hypothetical protein
MGWSARCCRTEYLGPDSTNPQAEVKAIWTFRRRLACQELRAKRRPASGRQDRWLCRVCFATLHYPEGLYYSAAVALQRRSASCVGQQKRRRRIEKPA